MRPTLLEFRSTKEKTPPYYVYKNSYDGRIIDFKSPKGDCKRSSFSLERRFIAYDILAKKLVIGWVLALTVQKTIKAGSLVEVHIERIMVNDKLTIMDTSW